MNKLGVAVIAALALAGLACKDDASAGTDRSGASGNTGGPAGDDAGDGSAPMSDGGDGGSTSGGAASCLMGMSGASGNPDCDLTEYSACVVDSCADEIEACLGPNWQSADYAGSVCESLCTASATNLPTMECVSCLQGDLAACTSSACEPPACALSDADGGAAP